MKDTDIQRAVSNVGNRSHVLVALAADGRDFLTVEDVAREHGIEEAAPERKAEAYVDALDTAIEDGLNPDWDALEHLYGEQADELLDSSSGK